MLQQDGVTLTFDAVDLRSGDRWLQRLSKALAACSALVVLVGRDGLQRWAHAEFEVVFNRHLQRGSGPRVSIHPVLLPGARPDALPPFLALFQAIPWLPESLAPPPGLSRALKQHDENLAATAGRIEGCPYRGLSAFRPKDAALFFGRRADTMQALAGLGDQQQRAPDAQRQAPGDGYRRWLQVEGHSGSGKSSLVRAGLLPMVERGAMWPRTNLQAWRILGPMMPGAKPMAALAEALEHGLKSDPQQRDTLAREKALERDPTALAMAVRDHRAADTGFLLVIDQFEELFTLAGADQRAAFEAQLGHALDDADCPLYIVSTMRSDFIDRMALLPELSRLRNTRCTAHLLPNITRDGLREVIEGPARLAGLDVSEVTAAMLREADGEPGALPLVEHALTELWHQRQGSRLSGALFESQGGLAGLLSSSADALLDAIEAADPKAGRTGALELLLRLTRINTDDALRHSRQRIARDEALAVAGRGDAERGQRVLQRLAGQRPEGQPGSAGHGHLRLVTTGSEGGRPYVDLIHETLVRARPASAASGEPRPYWPTLYRYIEANRDRDVLRQQLALRVGRWQRARRQMRWTQLAGWGQLWDYRRLRPARHSAEGRFLRWSRRVAAVQIGLLTLLVGTLAESTWWASSNNLPFTYVFAKPLWALGWTPVPETVQLPPGRFTMGCKPGRDVDARQACEMTGLSDLPARAVLPAREVVLDSPCAIGRYEVTFAEYDRYVWATGGKAAYPADGGWGRHRRPAIDVSWSDAQAYVAWLSRTTKVNWRLPTEAEWEYAARGGLEARYPWGDAAPEQQANWRNCSKCPRRSTPVGSFPANGYGLHDMAGNVGEWVEDAVEAADDRSERASRVLRGGSWLDDARDLRAASRLHLAPVNGDFIGFRVCRVSSVEKPVTGVPSTVPLKR